MELERVYRNNQFNFGEDLYKIKSEKPAEIFFKEALKQTIDRHSLKKKDKIKVIFLYEDTKFYTVEEVSSKETIIQDDFDCIDFNIHRTKKGEFKIGIKWVKFSL